MDFSLPPDLVKFQQQARAFYAREMASPEARQHRDRRDLTGYGETFERGLLQRAGAAGILGVSLPEEYGGGGKPLSYKAVGDFEASYHDAPAVDTGVTLIAPALLAFGSPEQKRRLLPRIAAGEVTACIAYTERNAGSDLANIETFAELDGDHFVLTGEKALVTGAHKADLCLTLARTDRQAPRHKGMTMLLLPMNTPGITVRRRETMNGWTLCDLEFAGVRVPQPDVVGQVNNGFYQVAAALASERSGSFHYGWSSRNLHDLAAYCRSAWRDGQPLSRHSLVRAKLAQLQIELATGMRFAKRLMWLQAQGQPVGHEASINKVHATELLQRIAQAATQIMGLHGGLAAGPSHAPLEGRMAREYLERVHGTIGAGTSEIHRNTLATRGLGLPR